MSRPHLVPIASETMKTFAAPGRPSASRRSAIAMAAAFVAIASMPPGVLAQTPAPVTTVSVSLPTEPLLVQINQVALERVGPKRAIVESTGAAASGRYRVLVGGKAVAQGQLKALPAFSAWGAGKRYFEVDFSRLQRPGVYRVEATLGGRRVLSAPVLVKDNALFTTIADKPPGSGCGMVSSIGTQPLAGLTPRSRYNAISSWFIFCFSGSVALYLA